MVDQIFDSSKNCLELSEELRKKLASVFECCNLIRDMVDTTAHIPEELVNELSNALENDSSNLLNFLLATDHAIKNYTAINFEIQKLNRIHAESIGTLDVSSSLSNLKSKLSLACILPNNIRTLLDHESVNAIKRFTQSIKTLCDTTCVELLNMLNSPVMAWLRNIDFSNLRILFEELQLGANYVSRYKEYKEKYLMSLSECYWFPYVGLASADIALVTELSHILATSRGQSKRRVQRIDRAIRKYYTNDEIKHIKRRWKDSDLELYMKKILGQAIDAHLRGEYVLCISCLATTWEGLIYVKANNASLADRHRQKTDLIKKDLAQLVDDNRYSEVFTDYYSKFIVSQCDGVSDVIDGVPNRHGVAHAWYNGYPNKKASLNAILITDFIIGLKTI